MNTKFPGVTSLFESLDKKFFILLKDGRVLIGILRSYDQYTNLVLESTIERIIVNEFYCDFPRGKFIIRSENVVIMGEYEKDVKKMKKVTKEKIHELKKFDDKLKHQQEILKKKLINEKGIIYTPEDDF
eukprot:gene12208-5795_t